ncbi:Ribonucleoside-diphosphate reductase subunit M2 [Microtus ochrogaster]|uniref:Ribonucleoside-diphosphate reductase subunit M2 n=1 Tax=Microtus ochrogaster TaxID=79684 RepID=A0A8J6GGF3_MICOH|nr:Ribonucleoside-diphosphate reductase subunit M2 [Microtus ochrogaster]
MLSACVPLATATVADQQQLRRSPLKRLNLSEKENKPPSLSGTRILASKAARRIFLDPANQKVKNLLRPALRMSPY